MSLAPLHNKTVAFLAQGWVHCVCGSLRSPSDPCPCHHLAREATGLPSPAFLVLFGLSCVGAGGLLVWALGWLGAWAGW